jgi:hypothetical protein
VREIESDLTKNHPILSSRTENTYLTCPLHPTCFNKWKICFIGRGIEHFLPNNQRKREALSLRWQNYRHWNSSARIWRRPNMTFFLRDCEGRGRHCDASCREKRWCDAKFMLFCDWCFLTFRSVPSQNHRTQHEKASVIHLQCWPFVGGGFLNHHLSPSEIEVFDESTDAV